MFQSDETNAHTDKEGDDEMSHYGFHPLFGGDDDNHGEDDKDDDEKSLYGFHPLFGGDDTAMSPPTSPTVSPRRQVRYTGAGHAYRYVATNCG